MELMELSLLKIKNKFSSTLLFSFLPYIQLCPSQLCQCFIKALINNKDHIGYIA